MPASLRSGSLPYNRHSHQQQRPTTTNNNNNHNTKTNHLITVIPPASLPSNPPQVRSSNSCSGYGPPSAFSRGILLPLYPTLAAQMAAIAREYGLPSTGGMMVYMLEASPQVGDIAKHMVGGPKISEAAWQILWAGVFEEEETEAFARELQLRDQLYSDPIYPRYNLNEDQEELEDEPLNSSLEDLIGSVNDFPIPPISHPPPLGRTDQDHDHTSPFTPSRHSKLHLNHKLAHPRFSPNQKTDDRYKLADRLLHHSRSHSSVISNRINPTRLSHPSPAELPSRPSSALSGQQLLRSIKQINSNRHPHHHPAPISDRGSCCSSSSFLRPRRIGAGMIVGKIEFDIDCSRSTGRWYEQWLNPSRPARNDYPSSNTPISTDISRPLLLPHLITKRSQPSTSPNLPERQSPITQPSSANPSLRTTNLSPSKNNVSQTDNSHSFLAFDDPAPSSNSDLNSPHRPDEYSYRNQSKLNTENRSLDSGRVFYANKVEAPAVEEICRSNENQSPGTLRHPRSRIVSNKHRQAISLIEAQAKHQALVDQIDAQLSSPIKLEPVPVHPTFGLGNTTITLPGLSLELINRPEQDDSRYKQNEEGFLSSSTSSPDSDPANLTHSSTGSSSNSSVDVPESQGFLLPGLWSSKRSSSMAIEANLKELEQALVTLSPRALRSGAHVLPSPSSLLSSSSAKPLANIYGSTTNISSPEYLPQNGKTLGDSNTINNSSNLLVDDHRGGMTKFLDSLQDSYHEIRSRSSIVPPTPPSEVPVGNTAGYSPDDLRETHAPISPLHTSSFSSPTVRPNSTKLPLRTSSFFRKNHVVNPGTPSSSILTPPSTSDGFVSKAAGIVGKFRGHTGVTPKRKPTLDNITPI